MKDCVLHDATPDSVHWLSKRLDEARTLLEEEGVVLRPHSRKFDHGERPREGQVLTWWSARGSSGTLTLHAAVRWSDNRRFLQLRFKKMSSEPVTVRLPMPDGSVADMSTRLPILLSSMSQHLRAGARHRVEAVAFQAAIASVSRNAALDVLSLQHGTKLELALESRTPWSAPMAHIACRRRRISIDLTPEGLAAIDVACKGASCVSFTLTGGEYAIEALRAEADMTAFSAVDILRALSQRDEGVRLCAPRQAGKTAP